MEVQPKKPKFRRYWSDIFSRSRRDVWDYIKVHVAMALLGIAAAIATSIFAANSLLDVAVSKGYISDASNATRTVGSLLVLSFLYLIWSVFYYPPVVHEEKEARIKELEDKYESEPRLEIIESVDDAVQHGQYYKIAKLEIKNTSQSKITKCFATLEFASDMYPQGEWMEFPIIPSMAHQPDRIRWVEDGYSNELCEIEIPRTDSRHLNLADTLGNLHYNLKFGTLSTTWLGMAKVHKIKVRIDGEWAGGSLDPLYFEGYFYYSTRRSLLTAKETKNGKFAREISNVVQYSVMIFKKGNDWTKDENIQKAFDEERTEGEQWKEYYEKQQEENNEATEKWIEENKLQTEEKKEKTEKTPKKRKPSPKKISSKR